MQTKPRKRLNHVFVTVVCVSLLLTTDALAANPIPTVVAPVLPQAVLPGSGDFTLTVYGANFVPGAVVNWNRQARTTTFVSARELQAQILASDVTKPTAGYITVTNPPPGGGVSSSSYAIVEVHTPDKTIALGSAHELHLFDMAATAADFNGDGILDLVGGYHNNLKVAFGNGDGTFRLSANNFCYQQSSQGIFSGDFNNDATST